MVSIVFPAYNEEKNVRELYRRILEAMRNFHDSYEIVAVNNASTDNTREELLKLAPIRVISLAYNIGQSAGLDAGIQAARGDVIMILDADLQNDPADIPLMYAKLKEGYDVVVGWRKDRHDPLNRKIFSWGANWISRKVFGLNIHDYACASKMFKKDFIKGIHLYGEMHVFLAGILKLRGAKITEIVVRHHERKAGFSKHNFIKGVKDLADLLTIKFLFSASRPMLVFGILGFYSWLVAVLAVISAIVLKVVELRNFGQTPLPTIASLFIILGFLLVMLGLLAELLIRTYFEANKKTPYFIKEEIER